MTWKEHRTEGLETWLLALVGGKSDFGRKGPVILTRYDAGFCSHPLNTRVPGKLENAVILISPRCPSGEGMLSCPTRMEKKL